MSKGSTQRPGNGYHAGFDRIFKKGNTMPTISERRRDAGSGQQLQFYEGADDRRSDAMPDWISYNALADVLTIHGINYSGDLFREFGSAFPVGQAFKLANRADGVLTIMRLPDVGGADATD